MSQAEDAAGTSRALVVVPTYNEAANIDTLLDRVFAAVPDVHVLVVDDSSPDGTADLVATRPDHGTRAFLLERAEKQGLGAAYRAGFGWAFDHGYDVVVQMDADLSHPPERLPALLEAIEAGADVAVGSRYVRGGGIWNWAWRRRVLSRLGNLYVALVLGLGVRDATAGFKALTQDALRRIGALTSASDGYCFQIENAWRAQRAGLQVVEVPITFTDRLEGTSKMSGSIAQEAVVRVAGWRLAELRAKYADVLCFLLVGAAGYLVDVIAFNLLRNVWDPTLARTVAVIPAMVVTYLGNRLMTWRSHRRPDVWRQLCLFCVFNLIGFGFSIGTLAFSRDLLGLRTRLADNISANVVGLALGTLFRYLTYRYVVFAPASRPATRPRRRRTPRTRLGRRTLAACTSWWSTTRNALSSSSGTISSPSEPQRTDATTG